MMMDKWTERLSEYIDGDLTQPEREALEAHLMSCPECSRTLQELRAVVARAGQVIDREPESDLWAGIAARIQNVDEEEESTVATSRPKRRVSFSVPQLIAASVVLMVVSASTVYMMLRDVNPVVPLAQSPAVQTTPGQASVRSVTRNYDSAVNELEAVLERNRTQLDTSTVRVLEQNLAIIDRAIADARNALAQEPGNQYLTRYLDATMQRKVQLLRRATSVMRAQT
jgi:anti-sigma factor RsiW